MFCIQYRPCRQFCRIREISNEISLAAKLTRKKNLHWMKINDVSVKNKLKGLRWQNSFGFLKLTELENHSFSADQTLFFRLQFWFVLRMRNRSDFGQDEGKFPFSFFFDWFMSRSECGMFGDFPFMPQHTTRINFKFPSSPCWINTEKSVCLLNGLEADCNASHELNSSAFINLLHKIEIYAEQFENILFCAFIYQR